MNAPASIPNDWDRRGLPAWAYHSQAQFDLERDRLFLRHWQLAGHVSDLPQPGDWISFDLLGERAVVMRGRAGEVRSFHTLSRHRGARVVAGPQGNCKGSIVCPFHGWVYNLDGSLRGAARPETFGRMDRSDFGLKPVELEIWHGFVFLRFQPGPQPAVAEWLAPYADDFAAYRATELLPVTVPDWTVTLPVNWKSVRDVDNEGYHVALAHPSFALARFKRFRGRTLFSGLVTAPLIMPEVITGISSLIFFILMAEYLGWPAKRGFTTVTLAHITFSLTFVTTVVHSRLIEADVAIEEAAMDLGSRPWQVMQDITLPVISPAILSGWLLAFTISLDDVVITSFTTGPGTTTLPILIWSKVKLGVSPDINALATLIVLTVGIGVVIAGVLLQRGERRRERDTRLAYQANQ